MSLARLLVGVASRTYAQHIGLTSKNQYGTIIVLPTGSAVGDFCIIVSAVSATISTTSSPAWPVIGPGTTGHRVYYRQLVAADLVPGAIRQSEGASASIGTWRGPSQLSTQRSSLTWSTPNPTIAPGFTKSLNAQVIVGVGDGTDAPPTFITKGAGGQFDNSVSNTGGPTSTGMGEIHLIDSYVNGTAFPVTSGDTNLKRTEYYELLG